MSGKKSSKSRGRRIASGILKFVLVCLAGACIYTAAACGVRDITVRGNYHESEEEIIKLLGDSPLSKNSVFLYLTNRNRVVKGNTFVDTLTVDLDTKNSITVNVSEKKLIGYVEYNDRYWYFNQAGLILVSSEKSAAEEAAGSVIENADVPESGSAAETAGTAEAAENAEGTEAAETAEAAENAETAEGAEAAEIAETAEVSPELLVTGVTDAYELSSADPLHSSGMRIVFLSSDEVIYGDEAAAIEVTPDEEAGVGAGETEEAEFVPEAEEEQAYDPAEETYEEPSEEDYESSEETYTDTENYDGELSEEYAEDTGEDSEEADATGTDPEIITPSESGDAPSAEPAAQSTDTTQTWELDTSAKGGNYLPLVEGLVFSEAALGYPLPVQFDRVFSSIAVLKSFVDRSGYVPDTVSYAENGDLIVTYKSAAVNLGNGEHIEQRVSEMGEALPSFAGLSGTLHLENYDGTQKRLIFSKN